MKMIEQFTAVLAKVIGLRSTKKIEETQQVLNEALHHFTGLGEATIERLSYRDLINLVSGIKEINAEKCIILAELLKAKADVYLSSDNLYKSFNLYLKSFTSMLRRCYQAIVPIYIQTLIPLMKPSIE